MAKKNLTNETIVCEICGEDIIHGDLFYKDCGLKMCELCHEERQEYYNDSE